MVLDSFGILHLPESPASLAIRQTWGDCTVNRVLIVLCIIIFIFSYRDYRHLFPMLAGSLDRWRSQIHIQHNIPTARIRNNVAVSCIIPFCLMASRYALYTPAFYGRLPLCRESIALMGIILAYVLLRRVIYALLLGGRHAAVGGMDGETMTATRKTLYSFFILLCCTMLFTCAVMFVFHATDAAIRTVLLLETALFFTLSTYTTGQILGAHAKVSTTILYLCILELIPAAALIASAVVL